MQHGKLQITFEKIKYLVIIINHSICMQMEAGLSFKYRLLCLVVCFGLIFLGAMFYALSTKGSRTCSVSCYVHDFSFMIKVIVCLGPG